MSRRLFGFGRALYASPDYVAEMGLPSSLDAMCNHRLIVHSMIDSREVEWRYHGQPLDNAGAMPPAKWCINDSATLERFALSGAGIALLPTMEGDAWVARGELLRVLPPYEGQGATVSLVWPASRHLAPRIRAFIDHAVETLGQRSSR